MAGRADVLLKLVPHDALPAHYGELAWQHVPCH
jgi:hypothetical protein